MPKSMQVNQPSRSDREYVFVDGVYKKNVAYVPRSTKKNTKITTVDTLRDDFRTDEKKELDEDELYDKAESLLQDSDLDDDWVSFTHNGEKYYTISDFSYDYSFGRGDNEEDAFTVELDYKTGNEIVDRANSSSINKIYSGIDNVSVDMGDHKISLSYNNLDDFKNDTIKAEIIDTVKMQHEDIPIVDDATYSTERYDVIENSIDIKDLRDQVESNLQDMIDDMEEEKGYIDNDVVASEYELLEKLNNPDNYVRAVEYLIASGEVDEDGILSYPEEYYDDIIEYIRNPKTLY